MKILCLAQNFCQGWGGAPESIRLLARSLASIGFSVDVFDRGKFHARVEELELLPERGAAVERFSLRSLEQYQAVLIVGPWQYPWFVRQVLQLRNADQALVYLPRGGLGAIEFARSRDLKKWPYLYLIERPMLDRCSAVVYSSECEQRHTTPAMRARAREVIIPDFFSAPEPPAAEDNGARKEVRFGFLAEISPRKGLVPTVDAFVRFASRPGFDRPVRLSIGGSVRVGSEAYAAQARALAKAAPPHATIEFHGPVAHADRAAFYAGTDVFVAPSLFESYGLTVLEALSAGCAQVTAPELGVLEYLPAHARLSRTRSTEPGELAVALAVQFEIALASRVDDRGATSAYAQRAIAAINSRATAQWLELLRGGQARD